jgi:hypothetical protein
MAAYLQQIWGDAAARFRLLAENTTPDEADEADEADDADVADVAEGDAG